jgi:hypothetical protein
MVALQLCELRFHYGFSSKEITEMSKSLKSQPSLFMAMLAIALLASLLSGQGHEKWAGKLTPEPQSDQRKKESQRDRQERERQGGREERVKEVRGIVKEVDRDKGEIVVELSSRDSDRLSGMREARIAIDADTEIRRENNDKGDLSSIMEGTPVKIKVEYKSNIADTSFRVEADKVKLEIACKDGQGCPKNGECERACKSDACTCPMPTPRAASPR